VEGGRGQGVVNVKVNVNEHWGLATPGWLGNEEGMELRKIRRGDGSRRTGRGVPGGGGT
jgi:hypothetical protein